MGAAERGLSLTITFRVRHLSTQVGRAGPLFVVGRLRLDAEGASLHEWEGEESVPLADPVACAAERAALPPPGEYLGGALLRA